MKCDFCRKIGKYFSVDIEHGGTVPEDFDRFNIILSFNTGCNNFPDEIIRCHACGTYYYKKRRIDNEICNSSDIIEFEEITKERADEITGFFNSEAIKFSASIDKKLENRYHLLTETEIEIINIFKNRMRYELSFYTIAEAFDKSPEDRIRLLLDSLTDKKVLEHYNIHTISYYRII